MTPSNAPGRNASPSPMSCKNRSPSTSLSCATADEKWLEGVREGRRVRERGRERGGGRGGEGREGEGEREKRKKGQKRDRREGGREGGGEWMDREAAE